MCNYILNLSFGTWRNQLWFTGDDDSGAAFEKAKITLDDACVGCGTSDDFFEKATLHFESFGFIRICK